ncbi:SAM-dependent methyltransferase [Nitrospira sp. KM1]|uniref:class I SAM-dependent methyltransferase n=1 Tax=Nitrospira sp. KM1 TaxID=1936990 RepID=UPI0013A711DC|nr:SAM-dependent methyltransferase [Nitrospira sp. KM1]BCA55757.1 SAM-dependent methyltransferase [Nitrospira sp. KM1]
MTLGHPELIAAIASEISATGPIPFVRFMELALYHPQFGYYMRPPEAHEERIGWSGDFYTSSDVHPILGQALARQAQQVDSLLGHPNPFVVIEMGPGKGLLARHVLSAAHDECPALARRLRYVLIERSASMRSVQQQHLRPWFDQITWLEDLSGLGESSTTGLMFSNELPDAFPVHRVEMKDGVLLEIFVEIRDGRFVECLRPLSQSALREYLERVRIELPDGYRTEINLAASAWMQQVAGSLNRGIVMTIDYGHAARDLYGPERSRGTLICYHAQMTSEDPYIRVGLQDMTAHVDFTTLATVGEACGLSVTGFTNQMSFLMGLGVEELIARHEPGSREFQAAVHLLKPEGMGRTFKILVQHKGIERPELDGLAFKPFFGSALSAYAAV